MTHRAALENSLLLFFYVSFIKETIEESLPEYYQHQIENETILDICLTTNDEKRHRELPYCTIDKIVRIINRPVQKRKFSNRFNK